MPIPARSGRQLLDAFVQKLELDESATMEALLCDNSKFVAFITKRNCQEI